MSVMDHGGRYFQTKRGMYGETLEMVIIMEHGGPEMVCFY